MSVPFCQVSSRGVVLRASPYGTFLIHKASIIVAPRPILSRVEAWRWHNIYTQQKIVDLIRLKLHALYWGHYLLEDSPITYITRVPSSRNRTNSSGIFLVHYNVRFRVFSLLWPLILHMWDLGFFFTSAYHLTLIFMQYILYILWCTQWALGCPFMRARSTSMARKVFNKGYFLVC